MADLRDEFRRLRTRLKKPYTVMADELGMSYDDFYNGVRGESKVMQAHVVREVQAKYGLGEEWPESAIGDERVELKLYESKGGVLVPKRMVRDDSTGWVVSDGSMMPWLEPGDVVVVRPRDVPVMGKAMLVRSGRELSVRVAGFEGGEFVFGSLAGKGSGKGAVPIGLVTGKYRSRGSYEVAESDVTNGLAPSIS